MSTAPENTPKLPMDTPALTAAPQATPEKQPEAQPEKKPELPPKTKGERFYDVFQFMFGKVFIIAITAVLAFAADQKHAPDKIAGVPNVLKQFQGWFAKKVFHNKIYPVAEKGDFAKLVGGGLVGTMVLSHGGNVFAPFIKWMENGREDIANWYNKRFGTEQDVKDAHERLKDIPKQNWADIAKGRFMAWSTVFAAMVTAYATVGKDKKTGRYWLDMYEDKFARVLTGVTKAGKDIAATPIAHELTEVQKANKLYRFGKVLALDLYATTAGILIWNLSSRMSAKKRTQAEQLKANQQTPTEWDLNPDQKTPLADDTPTTHHRDKIEPARKIEPMKKPEAKSAKGYGEMSKSAKLEPAEAQR